MCNKESCQKPENLKVKPETCTPEQIKACHGEALTHPCVTDVPDNQQKGEPG